MYDKVSTKLEFVNREQKVLDFWKEKQVFEKSSDPRTMLCAASGSGRSTPTIFSVVPTSSEP